MKCKVQACGDSEVRWQEWSAKTEDDRCVLIELFGRCCCSSKAVRASVFQTSMKALCFLAVLQEAVKSLLTLTLGGLHEMDTGSVLCSWFSPVQEWLAPLLGVQLKHPLCLICTRRFGLDTGKEWIFTYHIHLWSMWSPFFTAHGKALSTHHSCGYRSFAILPFQPFQTAWHGSCTYPHCIPRCNVNIYKPILNRKQPCCGSTEVCAD